MDTSDLYFDASGLGPEKALSEEMKDALSAYLAAHPGVGTEDNRIFVSDLEVFAAKRK